jgi:chitin synthase
MGLIGVILVLMAGVGFLTFGFTEAVCGKPPTRFHGGAIDAAHIENTSVVIHGSSYSFADFKHPAVPGVFDGKANPLTSGGWNLAGNDASFLFQKVNQNCLGIITKASGSTISGANNFLDWYFPCNVYSQYGAGGANLTGYETGANCHFSQQSETLFNQMMKPNGQVYYTWDDVKNPNRNLAVFESYVEFSDICSSCANTSG